MDRDMFKIEMKNIVRPGRKVANGIQGYINERYLNQLLCEVEDYESLLQRLEAIFQPERKIQEIIVPYFQSFFELLVKEEKLRVYKGVSYNPKILQYGESVNLLDFYSWLKQAGISGVVIEASMYSIINMLEEKPGAVLNVESGKQMAKFFSRQKRKRRFKEIRNSSNMRKDYLNAAGVILFPQNQRPNVIVGEVLWRNKLYIKALQPAIEFCAVRAEDGRFVITRYAKYERYDTRFAKWYTVFVLAEALYMVWKYGINIKLGPTSESNFDGLINRFMKENGIRFGFVWYNREIEKEVRYEDRILFNDTEKRIYEKLENEKLKAWVDELMEPFSDEYGVHDLIKEIDSYLRDLYMYTSMFRM